MRRSGRQRLFVGGTGGVRYGVFLDAVAGLREASDLPPRRREVNVPLLFDVLPTPREEDRFVEVLGATEPSFLRLGRTVRPVGLDASAIADVPPVLATTAARWAWAALARTEEGTIVLLDARRLARIGARRSGHEEEPA